MKSSEKSHKRLRELRVDVTDASINLYDCNVRAGLFSDACAECFHDWEQAILAWKLHKLKYMSPEEANKYFAGKR